MNLSLKNTRTHVEIVYIVKRAWSIRFLPSIKLLWLYKRQNTRIIQWYSYLGSHPIKNLSLGIESSNGSLGHGLAYATGIAYGLKLKNMKASVYVVLGDGEYKGFCVGISHVNASNQLDNLYCIVDCNGFQSDGETKDIVNQGKLNEQFKHFGFQVRNIDRHNFQEIHNSLTQVIITNR